MNSQLSEKEKAIHDKIKAEYIGDGDRTEPIYDGIINFEYYTKTNPKILWILKEPYDDFDVDGLPKGGGWTFAQGVAKKPKESASLKSLQPICYISYGLINKVYDWNNMPLLRDSEGVQNALSQIAWINVNKLPGRTRSSWHPIAAAYVRHKVLLLEQIATYKPDIIFACEPHVHELAKDLGSSVKNGESFGSADLIKLSTGQRLIWVYHPNQRTVNREKYVNDAIRAAIA